MSTDSRRAIVERVFKNANEKGIPLDSDPKFAALVERWISEEIDNSELRRAYAALRAERVLTKQMLRRHEPKF